MTKQLTKEETILQYTWRQAPTHIQRNTNLIRKYHYIHEMAKTINHINPRTGKDLRKR